MKYFITAHDFHAEEDVELSVEKGEVLCATEGVAQDGWMKVEVITDALRRGYVPLSYLNELTAAEAEALFEATKGEAAKDPHAASVDGAEEPAPSLERTPAPAHTSSNLNTTALTPFDALNRSPGVGRALNPSPRATTRSPEVTKPLAAATSAKPVSATPTAPRIPLTPAQQAAGPVSRHLLENPDAAVDAFIKNEVYFKQLMQRRASALAQMQAGIEEAMSEVAACKDRNTVLTRKLRDLDEVVEHERGRWVGRVEEEKQHVSRSAPYSGAQLAAVPASLGATPVRSPIPTRQGGAGRSIVDERSPRQLRA